MWGWILATVLILILSAATAALVVYIVFNRRRADDKLRRDADQAALERETLAEALKLQSEDMARAEKELETSDEATRREIIARLARQRAEIAKRAAELERVRQKAASLASEQKRREEQKRVREERAREEKRKREERAREEKEREDERKRKRQEEKREREEQKLKRQEDKREREEEKREREKEKREREEEKRRQEERKPAPAPAPVPAPPSPVPTKPPTALELKYPHWGWDANAGLRCKKNDNTGCTTGWTNSGLVDMEPSPSPPPKPSPSPPPPSPSSRDNPNRIHESALKEMKVDPDQMSNILSMIGGPEQSNIEWWKGVDRRPVYGYCENINDGRGITVGVAGFVSVYNFPQRLIKQYGGPDFDVKKCRPGNPTRCDACDWIRSKGEDQKWQDLQWRMYASEFMRVAMKYLPSRFKDNALIKGLHLDTQMNAGEFGERGGAWGLKEVSNAAKNESDPLRYVLAFLKARGNHFTSGNTEKMRKGRLGAWEKLARDGKWDMRIDPCRYAYCSGKCLGCK